MQNLPTSEVYEKEFKYMPWGILIAEIQEYILKNIPQKGKLLDLLCGPGYLLGQIKNKRNDVICLGVDFESEYITYAKQLYSTIDFVHEDVLVWKSDSVWDAIVCTGGLHHLDYMSQEPFIAKLATLVSSNGFAIIADPYIDDYEDESDRKFASAKLGYEYLKATIQKDAPNDVLKATADLIANDVLRIEYKSSIQKVRPIFEKYFSSVEMHKTWPNIDSGYGDYYFILKK